jgi:GntR family transcriptional regulator
VNFPLRVDPDGPSPIYEQIARGVRALLASGFWKAGDRLPSVRETAVRLRVNPLTVVKAYRGLQDAGLLETRPGAGVFAARPPPPGVGRAEVRRMLDEALAQAAAHGLSRREVTALFDRTLEDHGERMRR